MCYYIMYKLQIINCSIIDWIKKILFNYASCILFDNSQLYSYIILHYLLLLFIWVVQSIKCNVIKYY